MGFKNKVLIIEANASIQNILTELLERDNDCVPLESCEEGLVYLENNHEPIDLIIMDLTEDEAVFRLISYVRSSYLYMNTPILLEVAPDQREIISKAFEEGADDAFSKPLNVEVVKKRVDNMLNIGVSRKVHNVMEDLIQKEIDRNIDVLGICPCSKCRRDLLTLTLNNVKPKYVSTEKGGTIITAGRLASMDDRIQLLADITRYAKLIGDNPHHEE